MEHDEMSPRFRVGDRVEIDRSIQTMPALPSYVGTVRQTASLAQLRQRDLLPFAEAARAGVPAIMTAHIVLTAVDAERPATVSQ